MDWDQIRDEADRRCGHHTEAACQDCLDEVMSERGAFKLEPGSRFCDDDRCGVEHATGPAVAGGRIAPPSALHVAQMINDCYDGDPIDPTVGQPVRERLDGTVDLGRLAHLIGFWFTQAQK